MECFDLRGQFLCRFYGTKKHLPKKRVQLPQDWLGTPRWPPSPCLGHKYGKNVMPCEKGCNLYVLADLGVFMCLHVWLNTDGIYFSQN